MKKIFLVFLSFIWITGIWAQGDSSIVVSISSSIGGTYNQPNFIAKIYFEEPVWDFEISAVKVINGYTNNLRIGSTYGQEWTVDVWANSNGKVGVYFPAGQTKNSPADDTWNAASDTFWVYLDYVAPQFSLNSTASNPTNVAAFDVTIQSNEYVAGFTQEDLLVENAQINSFTEIKPNREWILNVGYLQDGDALVSISADVAADTAQNLNLASAIFSRRFDTSRPKVEITTTAKYLSNQAIILVNVSFDEEVQDFDETDIYLNKATLAKFTGTGDNKNYELQVQSMDLGEYAIAVKENAAMDILGNYNLATDTLFFLYDGVVPICEIFSSETNPTANDSLWFRLLFSEYVQGFTSSSIYTSRGFIQDLKVLHEGFEYQYLIVNSVSGDVITNIKAASVSDSAGNWNSTSNTITLTTDHTPPTCQLYTTEGNPTNKDSLLIHARFSESVKNFTVEDIVFEGAQIKNFTTIDGGKEFSFYAYPLPEWNYMRLYVEAGSYSDLLDHPGGEFKYLFINYDISEPTVLLSSPAGSVIHTDFGVRIKFSEKVSNFKPDSIKVINGSKSAVYESQAGMEWSVSIHPLSKGYVYIWLEEGAARDLAGNFSLPGDTLIIEFNDDIYEPLPKLSTEVGSPTNKQVIAFIAEFNEEVTDFTIEDIYVQAGVISNFQMISANKKWAINLNPTGDGTPKVQIKSNVCTDLSGNANLPSNELSWLVDITAPQLTISSTAKSPTNNPNIVLTFSFTEQVTDFTVDDIVLENTGIKEFQVSSTSKVWTAKLVPAVGEGELKASVKAQAASDFAGNYSQASNLISIQFDGVAPKAEIIDYLGKDTTNTDTTSVRIVFNETVYGFELTDITLYNATAINFEVLEIGKDYRIRLKASEEGPFGLRIPYATVADLTGNVNSPVEKVLIFDPQAANILRFEQAGIKYYVFDKVLYLNYLKTIVKPDQLKVYNLKGELVLEHKFHYSGYYQIDLPFKEGIYILSLEQNKIYYLEKIFIGNQ